MGKLGVEWKNLSWQLTKKRTTFGTSLANRLSIHASTANIKTNEPGGKHHAMGVWNTSRNSFCGVGMARHIMDDTDKEDFWAAFAGPTEKNRSCYNCKHTTIRDMPSFCGNLRKGSVCKILDFTEGPEQTPALNRTEDWWEWDGKRVR